MVDGIRLVTIWYNWAILRRFGCYIQRQFVGKTHKNILPIAGVCASFLDWHDSTVIFLRKIKTLSNGSCLLLVLNFKMLLFHKKYSILYFQHLRWDSREFQKLHFKLAKNSAKFWKVTMFCLQEAVVKVYGR